MKKLFFIVFLLTSVSVFAQDTQEMSDYNNVDLTDEQYCEKWGCSEVDTIWLSERPAHGGEPKPGFIIIP